MTEINKVITDIPKPGISSYDIKNIGLAENINKLGNLPLDLISKNQRVIVGTIPNVHGRVTEVARKLPTSQWTDESYNLITGFKEGGLIYDNIPDYGLFKVNLLAKVEKSSSTVSLDNICLEQQKYYLEGDEEPKTSKYWFINLSDVANISTLDNSKKPYVQLDTDMCLSDELYRTYPNILPGYLYVNIEPELPLNFKFLLNKSTRINSPSLYVINAYISTPDPDTAESEFNEIGNFPAPDIAPDFEPEISGNEDDSESQTQN